LELSLNEVAGLTGKKGGKEGISRPSCYKDAPIS
jgi:hypothetical protein